MEKCSYGVDSPLIPFASSSRSNDRYREISDEKSLVTTDFASSYDFCIVLPAVKGNPSILGLGYIKSLVSCGFEVFMYKNFEADTEYMALLRAPIEKLRAFADKIDFQMLLDPVEVESQLASGDAEKNIAPVHIPHYSDITRYSPFEYIYGKYSRNVDERIYWKEVDLNHPFREIVRLKLSTLIMTSPGN